ncbi:MAG TPA: retroviral-like aspartic protease family protein [Steroidobacteraceae bacterium]|nr:retroviral-like aspartic protease family protein [Steroidobacteraceae bacterium]
MTRPRHALASGWMLGMLLTPPFAGGAPDAAAPAATPAAAPAAPAPSLMPQSAVPPTGEPTAPPQAGPPGVAEVVVEGNEPRYVAPTHRDRIGRIWAPVMIDGKGPFRLVLDTGANHSAVTSATATALGSPGAGTVTLVTGFTGSAVVPTIEVSSMEVGDLLMGAQMLPVVADVFGGAQGVLGNQGLEGKRIYADFAHDKLVIARSHGEQANIGFSVVPLRVIEGGLLLADVRVGGIRAKAIIDTGAQGSVGNLPLRDALMRHPPRHAEHADVVGVTLAVQSGDYVPAPEIDMGGLTITGVHITFGDMYLFQHWKLNDRPVLLIGMDLLGSFDTLIIDYRLRQLQIRLNRGSLPP